MMLVGAGAVGECLLKIMKDRDPEQKWLSFVLVCDYDVSRAKEVVKNLKEEKRFVPEQVNASCITSLTELIKQYKIDFVMDAAPPYVSNCVFNAAFDVGVDYGNMGTWSVPKDNPQFGIGIENSYLEPMTKYNFDRCNEWEKKGEWQLSAWESIREL